MLFCHWDAQLEKLNYYLVLEIASRDNIKKEDMGILKTFGRPKMFDSISADILKTNIDQLHQKNYYPEFYEILIIIYY